MISLYETVSPSTFATTSSHKRWRPAKHLELIDQTVIDALDDRIDEKIIIVEAPPRHGKSEFCSKWIPAWFCGSFPRDRCMLASYSVDLSRVFGRAARDLIKENGKKFEVELSRDSAAATEWSLQGLSGGMTVAGVGGSLTGKGCRLGIIDDPLKNAEEALSDRIRQAQIDWFQSTFWTRIEPGGVLLVIATRWHQDDLSGWIIKNQDELGVGVKRIHLPAIAESDDVLGRKPGEALWPERWPLEELEKKRKVLSSYWWSALFQQNPGIHGDTEWPDEYFSDHIWADTWPDSFEDSVTFIDPSKGKDAKKGDYSAIIFAGFARGSLWVEASIERRPVEKIVKDAIRQHYRTGAQAIGVEANAFQELLGPELQRIAAELGLIVPEVLLVTNTINKTIRISRLGAPLEHRQIKIKRDAGGELLVKQMKDFPFGDHDDGPDGLENAIRILNARLNAPPPKDEERWQV